ncbi:hypothetical protein FACS189487_10470 [Campylobacterota bacterium]|nr:hypothetical protein FACS189487_10470 [Campylobacterota bacterium]
MRRPLSQTANTEIGKYFFLLSVTTYAGGVLTQLISPDAKGATIVAGFVMMAILYGCGYYFIKETK